MSDLLPVHRFVASVKSQSVEFQVIKLEQSFFLWVGSSGTPVLSDLCLALQNKYQTSPLTTSILHSNTDSTYSTTLSQRLAKKTSKQVFISYNIDSDDPKLHQEIQARIFEELSLDPENF